MKKLLSTAILIAAFINAVYAQAPQSFVIFNPNNISTHIVSSGIFNQDINSVNTPAFQWPQGSSRFAVYTTGLCIVAKVNGVIRLASASHHGEYCPGYILNGIPVTNSDFKIYKVSYGDGPANPDWANWYKMVPFGAPYVDVNNNGTFETNIDTPGVRNAQQTIFVCMTDGFTTTHSQSEGFSGGTAPLFAETHFTAWGYQKTGYNDFQFLEWEILNKGPNVWESVYMGLYSDPDLGSAEDDYVGCDTARQLGFCYNADNMDGNGSIPSYGANPPAVGFILLKGCTNYTVTPAVNLKMTSFHPTYCSGCAAPNCEYDPNTPSEAYLFLKGFKKTGVHFMNPLINPPTPVFFCYTGDPETNTGWTEAKGYVANCSSDTGVVYTVTPPMDHRMLMNMGADNFSISPGDTQKIVACQLIARGTSNLNSVTKLKQLSDFARGFYYSSFVYHTISGTVKYLDNNQSVTSGMIKAIKLDRSTGNIIVLDSTNILPNGTYMLTHVPQDSVDIGLYPVATPPRDYLLSYYPSTIYWEDATTLYPTQNLTNINLLAIRISETTAPNSVNGKVRGMGVFFPGNLKDANIYAKNGNAFVRCAVSDGDGVYHLASLPSGNLKIIATRLGYKADSTNVAVTSTSIIDSVNFYLNRVFVGVIQQGNTVPEKYYLSPNYPNPFNPVTNIKFDLPESGLVRIKIYNLLGKEVTSLVNSYLSAGKYTAAWDASSFPSGVYFYRMEVITHGGFKRSFVQSGKMILLK